MFFRALAYTAFVLVAATGLIYALNQTWYDGLWSVSTPASVASSAMFAASGTIDYYPNNIGVQVPYLVYKSGSVIATKALDFGSDSGCITRLGTYPCTLIADALPSYIGSGPVEVRGTVYGEHVRVSTLSPAPL